MQMSSCSRSAAAEAETVASEGGMVTVAEAMEKKAARAVERVEAARAVVREAVGRAEATAVAVKEELRVEAARAAVMVAAARPVAMHWSI